MTTDARDEIKAAEREMMDAIYDALQTFTSRTGLIVSYIGADYQLIKRDDCDNVGVKYTATASYKTGDKSN